MYVLKCVSERATTRELAVARFVFFSLWPTTPRATTRDSTRTKASESFFENFGGWATVSRCYCPGLTGLQAGPRAAARRRAPGWDRTSSSSSCRLGFQSYPGPGPGPAAGPGGSVRTPRTEGPADRRQAGGRATARDPPGSRSQQCALTARLRLALAPALALARGRPPGRLGPHSWSRGPSATDSEHWQATRSANWTRECTSPFPST
jgi:hypothetical protein